MRIDIESTSSSNVKFGPDSSNSDLDEYRSDLVSSNNGKRCAKTYYKRLV